PVNNVRPAVDVTLGDAAAVYGKKVICVILTGMGSDGTLGAAVVKGKGGATIAQSGATCTVNGMPAALINSGNADKVVALDRISEEIMSMV
ncbi:MAG: chemotaxis protein CheB, partial [bacterium]